MNIINWLKKLFKKNKPENINFNPGPGEYIVKVPGNYIITSSVVKDGKLQIVDSKTIRAKVGDKI